MFVNFILAFFAICMMSSANAQWNEKDHVMSAHYANGDLIPYVLTSVDIKKPEYALILQPGGNGSMHLYGNFLVRSRQYFADSQTIVINTDATRSVERMRLIINDLKAQYPRLEIYLIGTSNGTFSTMALGREMDGEISGFIHTSSLAGIGSYDTREFKSRHLIVHHELDACGVTPYASAKANHEKYGTDFISVSGGDSYGDPCQAQSYHGYKNIESQVIEKIKSWMKTGSLTK